VISWRNIVHGWTGDLKSKLIAHAAGIVLMAIVFAIIIALIGGRREDLRATDQGIERYLDIREIDFGNPVDRALFRETLERFYPGQSARNDSLIRAIDDLRQRRFSDPRYKVGNDRQGLTWAIVGKLTPMYLQFLAVYVLILAVISVAAQRIALYRFVKMKQYRESHLEQAYRRAKAVRSWRDLKSAGSSLSAIVLLISKALAKGVFLIVLFTPAYVIAYSLKTSVDTSSLVFMMLLGIVSNGVLIHTANRFFTFLVSESRKGYVQTAIVKNLHSSYEWNTPDGISLRSLLGPKQSFDAHVFHHINLNARFQFIPALKEHAAFLVTGLIIIEMALNIQGHLCYELLQQILYRQYDVVALIVFGIFFAVKATEMVIDIWHDKEKSRYGY
jgi:hypothetical protein